MKRFLSLTATILMSFAAISQAKQGFGYQAIVRDASNVVVSDSTFDISVAVLQGETLESARVVYTETHTATTDQNGLLTLMVGGGTSTDDFSAINWGTGNFFVKTECAFGSTTTQMICVPFVQGVISNHQAMIDDMAAQIKTLTFLLNPVGEINADFSVSEERVVHFSKGNLEYRPSTDTWRFAENQFDIEGVSGAAMLESSAEYDGWISLFGWGTSGYNGKYPYMNSLRTFDYGQGSHDIANTEYDWGVHNAISNGGDAAGLWRTLTRKEWEYLLKSRKNASEKIGMARVADVNGMVLLPDVWLLPDSLFFFSGTTDFSSNVYTVEQWALMEARGAVFLPAAGIGGIYRPNYFGNGNGGVGRFGEYWTATADKDVCAYHVGFPFDKLYNAIIGIGTGDNREDGRPGWRRYDRFSVRLVRDSKANQTIEHKNQ
ncbi:MAG: hypothetical protein IJ911_12815 [Salinivirgaceae bacterium]|nr:hypothetical protein [Salinivirgaceae bacterium]